MSRTCFSVSPTPILRGHSITISRNAGQRRSGVAFGGIRCNRAKVKGRKVVSITAHKRRMSPATRTKVAAAQKARWAKGRKAQKTGAA